MGLGIFERAGIHHDCLSEGRICVYWHGNASGTWSIKTRRDQAFCTATLGTTGTTKSGQGDYDRAVGRHHDKTLLTPDVVNFGSENWLDEMCNRSLNLRIRANGLAMLARLSHQFQ